jgi:hypothetical protein
VVEEGPGILDPYEPYIALRIDPASRHTVAEVCEEAVEIGHRPLAADILRRCSLLFDSAGIDAGQVRCRMEPSGPRLLVHLDVPGQVRKGIREALAVRALDAVRATGRTYGAVNVQVHEVPTLATV